MATREDDPHVALLAAADLMSCGRFDQLACANGDVEAARRVTQVADVFVTWMRQVKTVRFEQVIIEEIDTGEVVSTNPGGTGTMTDIDTSQRARYVLDLRDNRNFPTDAVMGARTSDEAVARIDVFQAPDTPSGKDEVLATFNGTTGTSTIEFFDEANPTVVLAADVLVANPGSVASVTVTATVEEIPEEPAPEPEPPAPPV